MKITNYLGLFAGQLFCVTLACVSVSADDWPAWRHDAGRSAASAELLPAELQLSWSRELGLPKPAWPEDPRLGFDACPHPIVARGTLFVASARTESLLACDAVTGEIQWQFFSNGPIRFAPVFWEGRLFFGSDDGFFYCLDASNGELLWKYNAASGQRRVIGNERLISVWPVRGGPVLHEGKVVSVHSPTGPGAV